MNIKNLFDELIMTSDPITANKVRDIEILIEKHCDEMKTQILFWKKQHKIASDDWLTEAQNVKQLEECVTELKAKTHESYNHGYKDGYDDGCTYGFQEGYSEKDQELT